MRKRACFVIQRYGLEVNGGAELHCRMLAEHLAEVMDVEIMTTQAVDYITWKNEYPAGDMQVNGIMVHRYPTAHERDMSSFAALNENFTEGVLGNAEKEKYWLEEQGPYAPALIEGIRQHKDDFDVFIFYTYLYYTTVAGIAEVFSKAILVPTAHDEPYIRMSIMKDVFQKPAGIFYLTRTEQSIAEEIFENNHVPSTVGGVGIDVPENADGGRAKKKYHLDDYLIYVGRVDKGKMCPVLFRYYQQYRKRNETGLKLVLAGKECIEVPKDKNIISLGFISDEDKFDLVKGARALVLPSAFESLSMVTLEAMRLGIPVIVNGECKVLRMHCIQSNGGLYYEDYEEFEGILKWMGDHPEQCRIMGENGIRYVKQKYTWPIITGQIEKLVDKITE